LALISRIIISVVVVCATAPQIAAAQSVDGGPPVAPAPLPPVEDAAAGLVDEPSPPPITTVDVQTAPPAAPIAPALPTIERQVVEQLMFSGKWLTYASLQVGGMVITGNDIYKNGFGGALTIGIHHNSLSLEWMIASAYSMRAKGALNAALTDGNARLSALSVRRRWQLIPLSVAAGPALHTVPVLAVTPADGLGDGSVKADSVTQIGALLSARVDISRSTRGNLYADVGGFVPLFVAVPPTNYQSPGDPVGNQTPIMITSDNAASVALSVGVGFEFMFQ
jgi:hypothetical protein